jgi:hypothetical protein
MAGDLRLAEGGYRERGLAPKMAWNQRVQRLVRNATAWQTRTWMIEAPELEQEGFGHGKAAI